MTAYQRALMAPTRHTHGLTPRIPARVEGLSVRRASIRCPSTQLLHQARVGGRVVYDAHENFGLAAIRARTHPGAITLSCPSSSQYAPDIGGRSRPPT